MDSVTSNNQGAEPPVFSAVVSELMNRREKEIRELEIDLNELQKLEKQMIRELRERMKEQTAVYLRQKEQIASTQRMITKQQARSIKKQTPLKRKIELLKKRNAILQSSLSPIAKAPNEVLSHIFQEYVSMNLSPWLLTRISMRWRQVAISTPSLWSRIAIQDSPNARDTVSSMVAARRMRHFVGSRNICFKERELETILRYSGGASLDIIVNGSSENGNLQDNLIANLRALSRCEPIRPKKIDHLVGLFDAASGEFEIYYIKLWFDIPHGPPFNSRLNVIQIHSSRPQRVGLLTNAVERIFSHPSYHPPSQSM
jgi:hypothetical protein